MIIKKLTDPHILNKKIDLEGIRASLSYRERLQKVYKKSFTSCQKSNDKRSKLFIAMIHWNKLYINKLLRDIEQKKQELKLLYETERKLLYLEKR